METSTTILSALCVLFLFLSAFFSASETALFSIPRERIDSFREHEAHSRRLIYSLLMDGQRTLLLLLLCNLFVNITLTGLINSIVTVVAGKSSTFWSFIAATAVILLFGEILPKNVALRRNEAIAGFASPVLHGLKVLTSPLLWLIQWVTRVFIDRLRLHMRRPSPFITIDELKSAVRSSFERGVISRSEQGVIANLLDRGALPVTRFMTHRSQTLFLPHYTTAADALSELAERGLTCALVTRGGHGYKRGAGSASSAGGHQVLGVILLPDLLCAPPAARCRQLAQPPQWVPSTLETADLVSFMFAEKLSVVCVLDEFGGLSGIFQLSEGLPKLMNFRQERAASGGNGSAKIFQGLQEIDGMADWLPESLAAETHNIRTLNGLLTRHLGRIPKTGEYFDIDGRNFYIIYSGASRIESVLIRK